MPQPNMSSVHVNVPLTNMSVAYIQDQSHFIADRVFPNIPVTKQSDRYYVYSRADFNRDEMQVRAPGTESAGGGYTLDNTPTYYAPVWAYHKDIDDQIRANSDSILQPDRDATIFVTQKALIRRERSWAQKNFITGVWANEETGVAATPGSGQFLQWNDAGSTPIEDVRAAKRKVLEQTGFEPNKLTLGKATYDALVDHPDIIDRVKYGQTAGAPAMANASTLAQLFEVDEILVSKAVFNAGPKGADFASSATKEQSQFIAGNNALLTYTTPTPSIMQPTAGYTFSWSGWFGAVDLGFRIKKFRMEWLESDRVEIQMAFDQKVVAADLGFFFANAVA
jgi:hypothetical protein